MFRKSRLPNPFRALSLVTVLAAAVLASLALSGRVTAGAYTYGTSGTQRNVNAGVLVLNDTVSGNFNIYPTAGTTADNKDPYVFYILNQRIDIKPFGWNIVNPIAPTSVTSDIYRRWSNRYAGAPNYQLGQTLSPAMAAYWEVPLKTASSDDLAKFDILLLNLEQSPVFTAADTEKIRRFVDGGGTLWIENSGINASMSVPGLFFNLTFNNNGAAGSASLPSFVRSPLITAPFQLSESELNTLGDKHIGSFYADDGSGSNGPKDAAGRLSLVTVIGNSAHNGLPVIAAAQYGAGEIVVTTTGSANAINQYVGGVDVGVGGNSGPFCGVNLQIAPTTDLKLVADIIASTDSHLNEHQNSHQTGNDTGALPSAVQTWSYPVSATNAPVTGAVLNGHIAYAVVGANLIAYDLYPGEDLDGDGNPDDGVPDFNTGKPYDVIWVAPLGGASSAPTIGYDKNNRTVVLVELADGTVNVYNATTGVLASALGNSGGRGTYAATGPIPAPTYYGGRIYAGGGDGTLYVYDLATNASQSYPVDLGTTQGSGANTNPVLAAPTVGIVPDNRAGGKVPTNDIVALCVTNQGLFSVFLGSRGELLRPVGAPGTYNAKLSSIMGAQIDPIPSSTNSSYTLNNDGTRNVTGTANSTNYTDPAGEQLYADYDVDFANTQTTARLTRSFFGASAQSIINATGGTSLLTASYVSTPALDRLGNIYYTVTYTTAQGTAPPESVLYSVHDSPTQSGTHINWRFLLPTGGFSPGVDADGASYDALQGYQFLTTANGVIQPSAPVVDAQGSVYVLASKAGGTAILSFNSQGTITADALPVVGQVSGVNSVSITQPLTGTTDEFGNNAPAIPSNQYTVTSAGHIEFTEFGQSAANAGTIDRYPNLNEPYPLLVSFGIGTGAGGTTQNQNLRPLHTNVNWYSVVSTAAAASGVTLVGGKLYYMDGNGDLDSVSTSPNTITAKVVDPTKNATFVSDIGNTGVGATTAVPSASNGAMVINGPNGVTAYTNQVTLVVDANRVLEMDASGDAEWAVDATTRLSLEGDTKPIYNNGTTGTATGQYATTTLDLNRPSSVTELTANDYLVADTGNNRCVRFDRGGKVSWELTKFTDPNNKLKPGEPDTLNQPTSVQIHTETNGTQTIVRYLISDTGNDRIVEVDDIYDFTGNTAPQYHVLNWISHTHDVQGRDYRYQSASYYASPVSGKYYVVALVTNKRIAPFTYKTGGALTDAQYAQDAPSLLGPANQDVAGGTIVLLDYDPANSYGTQTGTFGKNGQADGFIATTPVTGGLGPIAISTIKATLTAGGGFDLSGTGTQRTLYIRNPRYLKVVTKLQPGPGGGTTSVRHYLLADDNGAWDLDGKTFLAQWGFTQADYRTMLTLALGTNNTYIYTPIDEVGAKALQPFGAVNGSGTVVPARFGIPFIPSSIQLLSGTDTVGTLSVGRYLITNSYSQGEAANNTGLSGYPYGGAPTTGSPNYVPPGFGGEVFEVDHDATGRTLTGGYGGHTLSRPVSANTSPLSQPTFAYRLQF